MEIFHTTVPLDVAELKAVLTSNTVLNRGPNTGKVIDWDVTMISLTAVCSFMYSYFTVTDVTSP